MNKAKSIIEPDIKKIIACLAGKVVSFGLGLNNDIIFRYKDFSMQIWIRPKIECFSTSEDDNDFIQTVNQICNNISIKYNPISCYLIQIDNWFDHKWLHFSGKAVGALGIWKGRTTLPPFHPNRIKNQKEFILNPSKKACNKWVHIDQWSSSNLNRFFDKWCKDVSILWYSSNSMFSGVGSLMFYFNSEEMGQITWYVSLNKKDSTWKINKAKNISLKEINGLCYY